MIFFLPGGLIASQELQQALAADRIAFGFDDEGASAAGTDKSVNLANQVFWKDYVCAYCSHINSATYEWDLVNVAKPS